MFILKNNCGLLSIFYSSLKISIGKSVFESLAFKIVAVI